MRAPAPEAAVGEAAADEAARQDQGTGDILDTRVDMTMVGGRIVFER